MSEKIYLGLFDVKTFLSHNHVNYVESGKNVREGWIGTKCPFCDDHSQHLGISPSMGISCWRCGTTGTVLKLVMKILGVDFHTAGRIIRDYSIPGNTRLPQRSKFTRSLPVPSHTIDLMEKYRFSRDMRDSHRQYIESRRYDPDFVLKKYDLHFAGPTGNFARRIIIPIHLNKKIVSFVGRGAGNPMNPKYKNCPDDKAIIPIKNTLYNIDSCKTSTILVVEGIMDAWRIGDGAVATLGTKFTDTQVGILKDFRRVFILYDNEPAAQKQAVELRNRLTIHTESVVLQTDMAGDPDDFSEDDVRHLRKHVFG